MKYNLLSLFIQAIFKFRDITAWQSTDDNSFAVVAIRQSNKRGVPTKQLIV